MCTIPISYDTVCVRCPFSNPRMQSTFETQGCYTTTGSGQTAPGAPRSLALPLRASQSLGADITPLEVLWLLGADTPPLWSLGTNQAPLGALKLLKADLQLLRVVTFTGSGLGIAGSSRVAKSRLPPLEVATLLGT